MKKVSGDEVIEVIIDHAPALDTVPYQAKRYGFHVEIEEIGSAEWKLILTREAAAKA